MTLKEPNFCSKTSWIQIGYGIWVNQIFMCIGFIYGFSSVALPQIKKEFNPTIAEYAFIASVATLSPPIGCILSGFSVDRLGRRFTLMVCVIPMALGWACMGFAQSPTVIIIGRTLTGVGLGMGAPTVFTFTTEISLPNIRGFLGVLPTITISLGITAQAILGALLNWRFLCYISAIYAIVLTITNLFLPESPYYVLMKGNIDNTKKNLQKFRAKDYDVEEEMEELRQYKEKRDLHKTTAKMYLRSLFAPSAYKPFIIITFYNLFAQFSGIVAHMFYAVDWLTDAKSSIAPLVGNIILGVTRLISAVVLSVLIMKLNRRPLAITSAALLTAVCISFGVYLFMYKEPSVFPVIAMVLYNFISTVNVTLPPMMAFELSPLNIRGLLGGIAISVLEVLIFSSIFCYPYMRTYLGFPQTFIFYGIVSLTGAIFLYFFLPETKGVSLQELEERFIKKPQT